MACTFADLSDRVTCPSAHVLDCGARTFAYLADSVPCARADVFYGRASTRTNVLHCRARARTNVFNCRPGTRTNILHSMFFSNRSEYELMALTRIQWLLSDRIIFVF
jgi:hypothetical protein